MEVNRPGKVLEALLDAAVAVTPHQAAKDIGDETLQKLTGLIIQVYAAKVAQGGPGEMVDPVAKGQITATEAAIFVDRLLQMVDLELFEIQMWRSLGSVY